MPAITINIDVDRLLPEACGTVVVDGVQDYAAACLALQGALHCAGQLDITIHHHTVATWLSAVAAVYGEKRVAVHRYTARDALRDRWQTEIPPSVTDRDILQANLLAEAIAARDGQSFADLVLEHFYSDQFNFRAFPATRLSALLNDYEELRWLSASRRPVVARMLAERLDRWQQSIRSDAALALVGRLREGPASLRRDLAWYKILRSYPAALGEKLLGKAWEVFRKGNVDTDALNLTPADTAEVATEVEYYLSGSTASLASEEDVLLLLEQMSGHLVGEFFFLDKLLRQHPDWVTSALLRRIELRFRPLRTQLGSRIAVLGRLTRPPFPEEPQIDWCASRWLSWTAGSYMPYYAWLERQGQQDHTVAGYAARFADWYYDHLVELKHSAPEAFAFSALYLDRERITTDRALALVILLDNFNYVHFSELCRLFNECGLSLEASSPVLSLIPTATEVGKAPLIANRGDQSDLPADRYADLVQAEWNPLLRPRTAAYMANIGELQNLEELAHDLYFLNFLPVDQALHEDIKQTGQPHADAVHHCLSTLSAAVAEFAGRFQIEERLLVYVISDHGSTRIARGVVDILDRPFYRGLALDKHHRYVALSDERLKKLPQVASAQCYVIDRQRFKTKQNYLAARQYYRFLDTTDGFCVHGGLTPEEVVVPFARFSLVPMTPEAPTLRLLNDQFRYAVECRVPVEVGNPNAFPLESVVVRLVDPEGEEVFLETLPAKQKQLIELTTRFKKAPGAGLSRELALRTRFTYQEREFAPSDQTFHVTMKTLMEVTGDDFDL